MDKVQDYYEDDGKISQSRLKLLLTDPSLFNEVKEPKRFFEEKLHFIIGDGVDVMLTQGQEVFDQLFYYKELEEKPGDALKSVINLVFHKLKQEFNSSEMHELDFYTQIVLEACDEEKYQPRWKPDTRVNKILEWGNYFNMLKEADGKTILSKEEKELIDVIVNNFQQHPNTKDIFNTSDIILSQLRLDFVYEGVECKSLLDRLHIDHWNKKIKPKDFKTMGDFIMNFTRSLKRNRYDIQAAFYTEAIEQNISNLGGHDCTGYTIEPFSFIVESTVKPGIPIEVFVNEELLNIGKFGRPEICFIDKHDNLHIYSKKIEGFDCLIKKYKYHLVEGFDTHSHINHSNGKMCIDWNGFVNADITF